MVERRKYPRFQLVVNASYKILDSSTFKPGKTRDISAEGVCFESQEDFKVGTYVALEIDLEDNMPPINLAGRIRWSQEMRITEVKEKRFINGVELIDIAKSDEGRFLKYYCGKMVDKLSEYLKI